MVTAKRKINNEQERYGGFSEIEVKEPAPRMQTAQPMQQVQPMQQPMMQQPVMQMRPMQQRQPMQQPMQQRQQMQQPVQPMQPMQPMQQPVQRQEVNRSFYDAQVQAAESTNYTIQKEQKPTETIIEPITTQYKQTAEDVMPKIRSQRDYAPAPVTKQKLDHKTKVVLGVYLSIILLLSALVLATGILLSSTGARVDDLESQLAIKTATYNNQLGEINVLSDDETIRNSAVAGGMEEIESAKEFDLLPMGDVPTYSETTNWFDSVCDWLNGVFGG